MKSIFAIAIACSLFLFLNVQASDRDWEQWDKEGVSKTIDAYWLGSKEEMEHRKTLASLTKLWKLPNDRLLEIGCGSGLIYNVLVPDVFPNCSYLGVDISQSMLDIATIRFPEGVFVKDDLYSLSFFDNSFEMVIAYEVFGHINDITTPIIEMFRTCSRLMIFTVWTGDTTKVEQEVINDAVFIHTTFSHMDILKAINKSLVGKSYTIHSQDLPGKKMAYIIQKH